MAAKWGICVILFAVLALTSGCRTPQPNLKQETTAERFIDPPPGQYTNTGYPKQAYAAPVDPTRSMGLDAKGGGVLPTRGGMTPGVGGMGNGYR